MPPGPRLGSACRRIIGAWTTRRDGVNARTNVGVKPFQACMMGLLVLNSEQATSAWASGGRKRSSGIGPGGWSRRGEYKRGNVHQDDRCRTEIDGEAEPARCRDSAQQEGECAHRQIT